MSDRLGILDRILSFMDRPWKAAVVIILIIVLGLGYALWEKRAEIADAIIRHEIHPKLQPERFKARALKLLRETNADAVMLIEGNLNNNSARDIEGYDRNEQPWIALTGIRPIIAPETPVTMVIRLLANEVVCFDVNDGGPEMRAEERAGIKRACTVVIPPIPNQSVGALWLGWRSAQAPENEYHVQYLMHDMAAELATW